MEYQNLEEWEDTELVKRSGAAGPYAELIRRNTNSLIESSKSSSRASRIMIDLTLLLMVIALLQLAVAVFSEEISRYRWLFALGVVALIALIFRDLKREYGNK